MQFIAWAVLWEAAEDVERVFTDAAAMTVPGLGQLGPSAPLISFQVVELHCVILFTEHVSELTPAHKNILIRVACQTCPNPGSHRLSFHLNLRFATFIQLPDLYQASWWVIFVPKDLILVELNREEFVKIGHLVYSDLKCSVISWIEAK